MTDATVTDLVRCIHCGRSRRVARTCTHCGTPPPGARCIACNGLATTTDADGIPLCERDYQHLLDHWPPHRA